MICSLNHRPGLTVFSLAVLITIAAMSTQQVFAASGEAKLLAAISARMPVHDQLSGRFEQKKYLAVLPQPLASKGEFAFARDSGLRWHVSAPIDSLLLFNQSGLRQEQNGETLWSVSADQPAASVIGRIISALLTGDWVLLSSYFVISGDAGGEQWQLQLTPRQSELAQMLTRIDLRGDEYVQAMTLLEANNDRTELQFSIAADTQ